MLSGNVATIPLLLDSTADVNANDCSHWTPLHHASQSGDLDTVRALLRAKASVNAKDKTGETTPPSAGTLQSRRC